MPDITMCKDETCDMKEDCYRYRAEPNIFYQSYFVGNPRKLTKCEFFIECGSNCYKQGVRYIYGETN